MKRTRIRRHRFDRRFDRRGLRRREENFEGINLVIALFRSRFRFRSAIHIVGSQSHHWWPPNRRSISFELRGRLRAAFCLQRDDRCWQLTGRADDVRSSGQGGHRGCAGRHPMPADLASRMTLALADAGESRLDRYPATSGVLSPSPLGSVFYARRSATLTRREHKRDTNCTAGTMRSIAASFVKTASGDIDDSKVTTQFCSSCLIRLSNASNGIAPLILSPLIKKVGVALTFSTSSANFSSADSLSKRA
jgi:hypothetical protein